MALVPAGYSARSLPDKLGYRAGQRAAFVALPLDLQELVDAVPFAEARRAEWDDELEPRGFDLIHAFTATQSNLSRLSAMQAAMRPDATLWVSWPKKASKVPSDVTEDRVREAALALDLVDVKVAAVDAVWSGLKLVIRKDRR
jgi:hypothetical protein